MTIANAILAGSAIVAAALVFSALIVAVAFPAAWREQLTPTTDARGRRRTHVVEVARAEGN